MHFKFIEQSNAGVIDFVKFSAIGVRGALKGDGPKRLNNVRFEKLNN